MPIDPTMYGGEPLRPESLVLPTQLEPVAKPGLTPAAPVSAVQAIENTTVAQQGAFLREQAERPTASVLESIGATFVGNTTAAVLNSITDPHFEPVEGHSNYEYLQQIPFQLTKDESEYFQKAKSGPDALHRIERLKDLRQAAEASGDSPAASMLAAFVDPVWVASGVAAARVASGVAGFATASRIKQRAQFMETMVGPKPKVTLAEAANASHIQDLTVQPSRLVGAGTGLAAGAAIGLSASEAKPMSTAEIVAGIMLEGAAGAMVPRAGRLVQADPDFPADELTSTVRKPHLRMVSPAEYTEAVITPAKRGIREIEPAKYIDEVVPGVPAVLEEVAATLPKELSRATPNYGYRGSNFKLEFESDVERAAYIVAGSGKSKQHDAYLKYLTEATGLDEGQIIALGQHVRSTVKQEAASATGESIKVPKLYQGDVRKGQVERTPAVPPSTKRTLKKAAVTEEYEITPAVRSRTKVKDAVYEEVPVALRHDAAVRDQDAVATAVVQHVQKEASSLSARIGSALQWNIHKTMSNFGPVGKRVADTLFDNNMDLSKTSVEAQKRAVKADLSRLQAVYESELRAAVAEDGYGTLRRIFDSNAIRAEQNVSHEVAVEMLRRQQLTRQGRVIDHTNVPPRIKRMADALDNVYKRAEVELKAAGVTGADAIEHSTGFFNRHWSAQKIESLTQRFQGTGMDAVRAHRNVVKLVAASLRKANGWDNQLSYDVAAATVNRALRKGMFEDAAFNANFGDAAAKQVRDILQADGLSGARLERALAVITGKTDEAGKAGFLKHRVDMDYDTVAMINGEAVRVTDLLDHNITNIVDKYLDGVSTQAAFARAGYRAPSDIANLRTELLASITDPSARGNAARLFDETLNYMQGKPTGSDIGEFMRNTSMVNRMISLGNSGLWQLTEYATAMSKYGALKTIQYAMAELPGFKSIMSTAAKDKQTSRHLKDVLTGVSDDNLRMRPFLSRYEDNFTVPESGTLSLKLGQAQQLVPYANGMKYVHAHQARMVSNLVIDTITQAAGGSAKHADMLAKYGVDRALLNRVAADIRAGGFQVDKWADGTWDAVRPALSKMMDESVLHQRLGDMPAFALLNPVGKFIFTYRSFVLTAHNKILAGGLGRDGAAGTSLVLLYQFPLAALAVQAQAALNGKKPLEGGELAAAAVGAMGGVGLASEVAGWVTGTKKQVGAPGLIPLDRGIKLIGDTSSAAFGDGQWNKVAADVQSVTPFLNIIPPLKAMGKSLTEE